MPQKHESQMEKRPLKTNNDIVLNDHLSQEFEEVLKDQFYFRDNLTHTYYQIKIVLNRFIDKGSNAAIKLFYKIKGLINGVDSASYENINNEIEMTYLSDNVIEINDGYLINEIIDYNDEQLNLAASRGYNINEFDKKYPNVKTYVYFPTRLEELLNNEKENRLLCRENYLRQLNNNISYSYLKINGIKDHQEYYFKSDGHWNAKGAYQGYKDIIEMINNDFDLDQVKEIEEEYIYEYEFKGNISSQIGMIGDSDHIVDYKLKDLGEYDYYADNNKTNLNDVKNEYKLNGNNTVYSDYDLYFGANYFLRIFDFKQEDKPNLLIFSDSFVNTNMSWIASHFNKTVIIDLRSKPEDFNLDYYINEYDIDAALILMKYSNMYFNGNLYIPLD